MNAGEVIKIFGILCNSVFLVPKMILWNLFNGDSYLKGSGYENNSNGKSEKFHFQQKRITWNKI